MINLALVFIPETELMQYTSFLLNFNQISVQIKHIKQQLNKLDLKSIHFQNFMSNLSYFWFKVHLTMGAV